MGKRKYLIVTAVMILVSILIVSYFLNAVRRDFAHYEDEQVNPLQIWMPIAIISLTVFLGIFLTLNIEKIKQSQMAQRLQAFLNNFEGVIFNTKTTSDKFITFAIIYLLFYGFKLFSVFIHEVSHAFAFLFGGGYTEFIEFNLNGTGLTMIKGPYTLPSLIMTYFAGFLGELIIALLLLKWFLGSTKNKRLYTLLILAILHPTLMRFYSYSFDPLQMAMSDAFYISQYLDISPYLFLDIFFPLYIITIIFAIIIIRKLYIINDNSKVTFLIILLFSFIFYIAINQLISFNRIGFIIYFY